LGITACAAVSYMVTKSDLSRTTDAVAGVSKEVGNHVVDLPSAEANQLAAWKIFQWKVWPIVGSALVGRAVGYGFDQVIGSARTDDIPEGMRDDYMIAQREALLDELN